MRFEVSTSRLARIGHAPCWKALGNRKSLNRVNSGRALSEQGEIHRHSGWLIPLAMFVTILALSGLMLLYYLRPVPGAFRDTGPTASPAKVALEIHGLRLQVPANYLETQAGRGGETDELPLFALLPEMRGYSEAEGPLFAGNAADSAVVHLLIRADTDSLDPASRLERIYKPYIRNSAGSAGPFGLTRYEFRAASGYAGNDLFVGEIAGRGPVLLLCERPAQDLPSPNCLATGRPIVRNVSLSYRFKRAQLARWREVDEGVGKLVTGFIKP